MHFSFHHYLMQTNLISVFIFNLQIGNYSSLPNLLNCNPKYNANENELVEEIPTLTENHIKVPLQTKPNTWVFYWATQQSDNEDNIKGPGEAYGELNNRGVQKTTSEGFLEKRLNCPQLYEVEGTVYPRHIHYVLLNKDKTWDFENVRTRELLCSIDKEEFNTKNESNTYVIIPIHEKHETDEFYLSSDMSKQEISDTMKKYIQKNDTFKQITKDKLPIILSCKHECSVGLLIYKKLIHKICSCFVFKTFVSHNMAPVAT